MLPHLGQDSLKIKINKNTEQPGSHLPQPPREVGNFRLVVVRLSCPPQVTFIYSNLVKGITFEKGSLPSHSLPGTYWFRNEGIALYSRQSFTGRVNSHALKLECLCKPKGQPEYGQAGSWWKPPAMAGWGMGWWEPFWPSGPCYLEVTPCARARRPLQREAMGELSATGCGEVIRTVSGALGNTRWTPEDLHMGHEKLISLPTSALQSILTTSYSPCPTLLSFLWCPSPCLGSGRSEQGDKGGGAKVRTLTWAG